MKNKHLALIFMAVLALGWLTKTLPLRCARKTLEIRLIAMRPEQVRRIQVWQGDRELWHLERIDDRWLLAMEQKSLFLPADTAQRLLESLYMPRTARSLPSALHDTLCLRGAQTMRIAVHGDQQPTEHVALGCSRHGVTYLQLARINSVFAAQGNLRLAWEAERFAATQQVRVFDLPLDSLRTAYVRSDSADAARLWIREHESGSWRSMPEGDTLQAPAMAEWLRLLASLGRARPSNGFDDSDASEYRIGYMQLSFSNQREPLALSWYRQPDPKRPRDAYFFSLERQPHVYYAVDNALAVRVLLHLAYGTAFEQDHDQ